MGGRFEACRCSFLEHRYAVIKSSILTKNVFRVITDALSIGMAMHVCM